MAAAVQRKSANTSTATDTAVVSATWIETASERTPIQITPMDRDEPDERCKQHLADAREQQCKANGLNAMR